MQRNTKKTNAVVIIMLMLAVTLTTILASCVPTDRDETSFDFPETSGATSSTVSSIETEISTAPGYTQQPVIKDVKNITANVIVVSGICEEGSTVTIKRGKEDVLVQSRNGYFIAEVTLSNTAATILEATALVDGKKKSDVETFTVKYDATAEKRNDKFAVSIGMNSQLYFDTYLDNYTGKNLFTKTQLGKLKEAVNNKVLSLENRAKGQDVELIYVLVPDVTSICPEIFSEDVTRDTFTIRYNQIFDTLLKTKATVVNTYDILDEAKKAGEYQIYRKNDSHLTEYGAYLVYEQITKTLANKYPAAAPRTLEEFDQITTDSIGGDFMNYLGIKNEFYTESVLDLKPKFSLDLGFDKESSIATINIDDVEKYNYSFDEKNDAKNTLYDYSIYSGEDKDIKGISDRFSVRTNRSELPCALIYRDDSAFSMIDILAERFNRVMIEKNDVYTINLTEASRYNSDDKNIVDYVVVIVSENNIEELMKFVD